MKKLQMISRIVLIISIVGFIVWRFAIPSSDWVMRVIGVLLLVSVFTMVFSTVKINKAGK